MERSEKLQNCDLHPALRWRKQKFLKCMNVVDPLCEMPGVDDDESSDSRKYNNDHAVEYPSAETKTLPGGRSGDVPSGRLSPLTQAVATVAEISATRKKLMIEYETDIGNLKEKILKNESSLDEFPQIKVPFEGEPSSLPVNSKSKLKSICTAPSPLPPPPPTVEAVDRRSENKSSRPRRKKEDRPKLSIALSNEEIMEDLYAMTGKLPPGKPKRRPRSIQTRLDALFPGSGLSEIHPDRYKVKENRKN